MGRNLPEAPATIRKARRTQRTKHDQSKSPPTERSCLGTNNQMLTTRARRPFVGPLRIWRNLPADEMSGADHSYWKCENRDRFDACGQWLSALPEADRRAHGLLQRHVALVGDSDSPVAPFPPMTMPRHSGPRKNVPTRLRPASEKGSDHGGLGAWHAPNAQSPPPTRPARILTQPLLSHVPARFGLSTRARSMKAAPSSRSPAMWASA